MQKLRLLFPTFHIIIQRKIEEIVALLSPRAESSADSNDRAAELDFRHAQNPIPHSLRMKIRQPTGITQMNIAPDKTRSGITVLIAVLFFSTLLQFAQASAATLGPAAKSVPSPQLVGKGRMTYLGFKVFDAELYAPEGNYRSSKPFALKLIYLRNFKGKDITKSSVKEMKRQGGVSAAQLETWAKQMDRIFPNVSPGQSITGVRTASGSAVFYLGSRKLGSINDPAFSKRFFSIWLGSNTRNPRLRAKLVGSGG